MKFYNALVAGAIPIVNGWRQSYVDKLPESFIHVSDFKSPAELASHVEHLMKNETAMLPYHSWRMAKRVDRPLIEPLCKVCEKMKYLEFQKSMGVEIEPKVIENPFETITKLQACIEKS